MAATTLSVALATFTVPMPMPKTPRWQGIYATVLAIVAFDPLVAIGLLPYYLGISVGRVPSLSLVDQTISVVGIAIGSRVR